MSQQDRKKIGRNTPCPCGSGLKYKRCCGQSAGSRSPKSYELTIDLATGKSRGQLPAGIIIGPITDNSANAEDFATRKQENVKTEIILQMTSPLPFVNQRYIFRQGAQVGYVFLNENNIVVHFPSHVLDPSPPDRPPPYSPAIAEAVSQYNAIVEYFNTLSPVPIASKSVRAVTRAWITWHDQTSGQEVAHRHYFFHGFTPEVERSFFETIPTIDLARIEKSLQDHLFGIESVAIKSSTTITESAWAPRLAEFINNICCELEDIGENFFRMQESQIRDIFLLSLKMGFPGLSVAESFAVHGKTDLRIYQPTETRFKPSVKKEFKIWNGAAEATSALKQLLAYSTGDEEWIGLVFISTLQDIEYLYTGVKELLSNFSNMSDLQVSKKDRGQRILASAQIAIRGIFVPLKMFVLDFGGRDYR